MMNEYSVLNTRIKIFDNAVDANKILIFLSQIRDNINYFVSDEIFNNLVIEVYNEYNSPSNLSAGLYYSGNKLLQMKIPSHIKNDDNYISNLLSHEFGHHWSGFIKWGEPSIIFDEWNRFRGVDQKPSTNIYELVAEDFRLYFGSNGAKNYQRGDYTQAVNKAGLKQFYECYKRIYIYTEALKGQWVYLSNLKYNYEANGFSFQFFEDWGSFMNWWSDHYTFINNSGVYHWSQGKWVKINGY